uniref:Uncharacterized protein n=1 Tax=uncultured Desulfobacterium sp. TaxID=201089 RepID=E1Y9G1_9BACT|nr:unknown protein [uncultured Desulfobacterium sp.]
MKKIYNIYLPGKYTKKTDTDSKSLPVPACYDEVVWQGLKGAPVFNSLTGVACNYKIKQTWNKFIKLIKEPLSKHFSFFKVKAGEKFNHRNTFSISGIALCFTAC